MKRYLILAALGLVVSLTGNAKSISKQQAQMKAQTFFQSKGVNLKSERTVYKAARTGVTNDDDAYYYVFNTEGDKGYVIVSGDDRTAEILAYADSGNFDASNMPENMRSWLQYYADRIKYLDDNSITVEHETTEARKARKASKVHHPIAPILTCNWNQGDPYNLKCPMYYNEDGSTGEHAATGCVATAIAQVLYHHKFPEKTKKRIPSMVNRYNTPDGQKSVSLSAITAGHVIDWANMCDNYYGGETQEQKDAVADLMLLVGQSVKMGYGASSGSSYADSRKLFVDYLGYDDGVQILRSDKFGIQEWFEMMYDELALGYPIGYGGSSTGGGHAFVVDGFDGDEFFHLNWGWGGGSNGYFRIDVLNPGDNSGIGASSSADGYTMGQDAIMYLRPYDDGVPYVVESDTHASINDTKITGTQIFSNYVNWTGQTNSFHCAIVMADEKGELVPITNVETISSLGANYYVGKTFDMAGKFSAPGEYHITPANKLTTNKIYRPLYDLKSEYIKATVDENLKVTLEYCAEPIGLEVTNWSFPGSLKAGEQQNVDITLVNNGSEFKRELALYASKTNDMGSSVSRALIGVKAGGTDEFQFFFKPEETGTYNLWLTLNSDRNKVIGQTTATIKNTAQSGANLAVNSVSVSNACYGNFIKGTMSVKNNGSKDFKGPVEIQFWKEGDGGMWWSGSGQTLYYEIPAGGSATAEFRFDNLEIGGNYRFCQRYKTQSGELSGGGVFDGSSYLLKKGALTYTKNGSMTGTTIGTTFTASKVGAATRFYGATPTSVTASSNKSFIYAFEDGVTVPEGLDGCNVVVGNTAEEINIASADVYFIPVNFTAGKATYSHTFDKTCTGIKGFSIITLPFTPQSITIDGEETVITNGNNRGQFWLKEFTEQNDDNQVVFSDATEVKAGGSYLIGAPEKMAGKTVVFTAENATFASGEYGTKAASTADFHMYGLSVTPRMKDVYALNANGSAFEYLTSGATISGAYFTTDLNAEARPVSLPIRLGEIIIGDASGDESITMTDANRIVNYYTAGTCEGTDLDVADANEDGDITMTDANMVVNIYVNQSQE